MRSLFPLLWLCASALAQPGAIEKAAPAQPHGMYPAEWPAGPQPSSQPEWAAPGRIRFARWDGGRLETAKAMLSGWPGFNPPIPDRLETMTNWYTPPTIDLLEQAAINTIWVTFSVGFSNQTERGNQEQLRRYIAECHRRGIRVLTYQSIANLFWEDMFEQVPESRNWVRMAADGKPTPYGAGAYQKMGRITRYMARLAEPAWRAYLRQRIDLALDAGADGIFYDNNFHEHLWQTYQEMYEHASSRKAGVLLAGNFHSSTYVLNRLTNLLSTEDGKEPGIYAAASVDGGRFEKLKPYLRPAEGGYLMNNIGLLRIHAALSEGWKPVIIEYGDRETEDRFVRPIPALRHKIGLAECMMFGAAFEVFSEGAFADGLMRGRPEAMEIWRAIARYNRFAADNAGYYADARPASRIAVVLDEASAGVDVLNGLAGRNVLFDIFYDRDLTPARLAGYQAVVQLPASVRPKAAAALKDFAAKGGKLFDRTPPLEALAQRLTDAAPPVARLDAPPSVLYHVAAQAQPKRLLVHLVNYSPQPKEKIRVQVSESYSRVKLLTPDDARQPVSVVSRTRSGMILEVPRLETYSLLVLER